VAAVRAGVPYIGLIASPKRGAAVLASLDLTDDEKARIHTPAGLNIGARTAGEIALSVFAQIIAERPSGAAGSLPASPPLTGSPDVRFGPAAQSPASSNAVVEEVASDPPSHTSAPATAIDPVCGMTVFMSADAHQAEVDGQTVWFCCPGCRREYLKHPEKYPLS
jgi:xanthine dehydrogenase accessory factor